jgi:hypothetical protein
MNRASLGVIFVLLIVIGLFVVIPSAPAFDSSPARIQQFHVQHRHDLHVGLFIASFGFLFFVRFLGSLVSHLRAAEGREGRLSAIVFGSGLIFIVDFIIGLAVIAVAAFRPEQMSAEVVRMLNDVSFLVAVPVALVATAFFAAIAKLSFKTGALPGWLSGLAVLAAIGSGFAVGVSSATAARSALATEHWASTFRLSASCSGSCLRASCSPRAQASRRRRVLATEPSLITAL